MPLLQHYLSDKFAQDAELGVYFKREDKNVRWPRDLASKMAKSAVLLPMFSERYFSSQWCDAELRYMLSREKSCGLLERGESSTLIVPVIVDDVEALPRQISDLDPREITPFVSMTMTDGSPKAEGLEEEVRIIAKRIKSAFDIAKEYRPEWLNLAIDAVDETFDMTEPKQTEKIRM